MINCLAHDATIAAVVGGKVQAGALNASVWNKFVQDKKVDTSVVKVFYTTPPYFDYNWTVRSDLDAKLQEKIRNAFLKLDIKKPEDKVRWRGVKNFDNRSVYFFILHKFVPNRGVKRTLL